MKLQEDLLLRSFPHPTFYPGQREVLTKVVESFIEGKKYVVLQVPVGGGKSAIAIGAGRYFGDPVLITTQTKALQAQYQRELPEAVVAKGASNYHCFAEHCDCSTGRTMRSDYCYNCEYKNTMEKVKNPRGIVIANNDLIWCNFIRDPHKFPFVCLDEAHNLEGKLCSLLHFEASELMLTQYRLPMVESQEQFEAFGAAWTSQYGEWTETLKGRMSRSRGTAKAAIARELSTLEQYNFTISLILGNFSKTPWVVEPGRVEEGGFQIKPVFAGFLSHCIFGPAQRVLMMSATICDYGQFLQDLRIPSADAVFIESGSSFPREHRPILYFPQGRMSQDTKAASMAKAIKFIDSMLNRMPEARGIIHTASFDDANKIRLGSKHRDRIITHESGEHEKVMEKFKRRSDAVLVSPSMWEGVDLKDDLARFNIIMKVPYPYLGDKQTKARMSMVPPTYNGRKWYAWSAVMKLAQAPGRSTRSPEDYSITVILDSCFEDIWKSNRKMFPEYFAEALHPDGKTWKSPEVFKRLFTK